MGFYSNHDLYMIYILYHDLYEHFQILAVLYNANTVHSFTWSVVNITVNIIDI